jgi:branched-subunit amino acid ABC-type transport system permease component
VKIFDAAVYGEIGIASATTMKLVLIVMVCMLVLNFISNKTRLGGSMKKSAAV